MNFVSGRRVLRRSSIACMNEPFRLMPVVVMLDVYRKGLNAVGAAARREAKHAAHVARRLARPSAEITPSLIAARLKSSRRG